VSRENEIAAMLLEHGAVPEDGELSIQVEEEARDGSVVQVVRVIRKEPQRSNGCVRPVGLAREGRA
jgi:hypothetical protein